MIRIALVLMFLGTAAGDVRAQSVAPASAHPATVRMNMVMNRARVMRLAELCRLRSPEWVKAVDAVIHDTFPDLAERVAEAMPQGGVPSGIGATWGGFVVALSLAEREHQTYGARACEALTRSTDLRAVDALVASRLQEPAAPEPRQPQRRRG